MNEMSNDEAVQKILAYVEDTLLECPTIQYVEVLEEVISDLESRASSSRDDLEREE